MLQAQVVVDRFLFKTPLSKEMPLTAQDCLVLQVLASHLGARKSWKPSLKTLEEDCRLSRWSLHRSMKKLSELNLIVMVRTPRTTKYSLSEYILNNYNKYEHPELIARGSSVPRANSTIPRANSTIPRANSTIPRAITHMTNRTNRTNTKNNNAALSVSETNSSSEGASVKKEPRPKKEQRDYNHKSQQKNNEPRGAAYRDASEILHQRKLDAEQAELDRKMAPDNPFQNFDHKLFENVQIALFGKKKLSSPFLAIRGNSGLDDMMCQIFDKMEEMGAEKHAN